MMCEVLILVLAYNVLLSAFTFLLNDNIIYLCGRFLRGSSHGTSYTVQN